MSISADRLILIHYHEVGLKGKNRGRFENKLMGNIARSLRGIDHGPVRRIYGRLLLELTPTTPIGVVRERLSQVFGIANFSEAVVVSANIEVIRDTAWAVVQKSSFNSFKVAARRADNTFP